MIKIKLCGFSNKETVDLAANLGVDFIGFVFHEPSPRNVTVKKAKEIAVDLPSKVKKVAVIADDNNDKIAEIMKNFRPDFLQLHGDQTPQRISEIKKLFQIPIIKAIAIAEKNDLLEISRYQQVADMFLFDAKVKGLAGGSGQAFDWKILQNLKIDKDWFLSGGLNINNIDQALKITGAKMIDLSSGIEKNKGTKSAELITRLLESLKKKYY